MSYNSIIPDGFIPTRECTKWLRNEAARFQEIYNNIFQEYYSRPLVDQLFTGPERERIRKLGLIAEALHNAHSEASDRYSNQPAFDWMKGGDF